MQFRSSFAFEKGWSDTPLKKHRGCKGEGLNEKRVSGCHKRGLNISSSSKIMKVHVVRRLANENCIQHYDMNKNICADLLQLIKHSIVVRNGAPDPTDPKQVLTSA